jgi:preprotein translocase subunit YajC
MSNSKNAIQEIKSLMVKFGFLADEPVMASFKLEDNTILETLGLKVGNKITKVSDEFERVALEDGSYRLVENFEIEVKNGSIETVKEIFLDAKLADGTVIKVEGDSLVEGAKVIVVTPDAEIPAPDGVHELEDGTKVETKDGIIAKIEEVVSEGEKPEVEVEVEAKRPSMDMSKEMMDMLKEFVSKMGEKMAQIESNYSTLENEFNAFKKEPAAKPIANGKTDFNKQPKDNEMDDKISMIMSLRKNNK